MPTEGTSTRTTDNPVLLSLKGKTKGRRILRNVVSTLFSQDLSVLGVKASESKALATTLSDTELEEDSDNEDDGILNAFTATINPTDEIVEDVDEEEELESKFEKMDDQDDIHTAYEKLYKVFEKHEKLYRLATKKLNDVELDREELSTKFDKANQTIGALRFENNFLAEKTKKLEAELFQVRAQLERTSSAKLDEMLSIQKSASD